MIQKASMLKTWEDKNSIPWVLFLPDHCIHGHSLVTGAHMRSFQEIQKLSVKISSQVQKVRYASKKSQYFMFQMATYRAEQMNLKNFAGHLLKQFLFLLKSLPCFWQFPSVRAALALLVGSTHSAFLLAGCIVPQEAGGPDLRHGHLCSP